MLDAAIACQIDKVVCLSTDKAVYPINAMGISKAMMEKVAVAKSRQSKNTIICVTRYGNVLASRGSVVPLFCKQIKAGIPVTITNPENDPVRYDSNQAVELVFFALKNGNPGDIFVQKSPAADLPSLVSAAAALFPEKSYSTKVIGTRHGEKLYEVLLSQEEMCVTEDLGDYFRVAQDHRSLNYDLYFVEGQTDTNIFTEYSSHNAKRLDVNEIVKKLQESELESGLL